MLALGKRTGLAGLLQALLTRAARRQRRRRRRWRRHRRPAALCQRHNQCGRKTPYGVLGAVVGLQGSARRLYETCLVLRGTVLGRDLVADGLVVARERPRWAGRCQLHQARRHALHSACERALVVQVLGLGDVCLQIEQASFGAGSSAGRRGRARIEDGRAAGVCVLWISVARAVAGCAKSDRSRSLSRESASRAWSASVAGEGAVAAAPSPGSRVRGPCRRWLGRRR